VARDHIGAGVDGSEGKLYDEIRRLLQIDLGARSEPASPLYS
jgi:hypothetical protein